MAKGESHRVYWQQWINNGNSNSNIPSDHATERNRRELITSSAAIRISEAARARDVTRLLRETLFPSTSDTTNTASSTNATNNDLRSSAADSLVLVGSLYSLPLDYIQFEHETRVGISPSPITTTSTITKPGRFSVLHVVKTLPPNENPLCVWEKMLQHLNCRQESIQTHRTRRRLAAPASTISPKLQWFFVPGYVPPPTMEKVSTIPSYIDLEGYCSAMEEDDDDDVLSDDDAYKESKLQDDNQLDWYVGDSDDCFGNGDDDDCEVLVETTTFPWQCSTTSTASAIATDEHPADDAGLKVHQLQRQQQVEQRLSFQISEYQEQHPHCKAGFLLLQSHRDAQVWRQVYCILTGEYLWYVSRLYHHYDDVKGDEVESNENEISSNRNHSSTDGDGNPAWARHGRIPLSRALLLEHPLASNTDATAPRILLGFEIVQANGTSHIFRASSRSVQQGWIQKLSWAMSSCHENSLFEHAQVIVEEETRARFQRLGQVAVHPLWDKVSTIALEPSLTELQQQHVTILPDGNVMNVLRLGMQIASYREQCRHAKQHQQQFKQQQQQQDHVQMVSAAGMMQPSSISTPQQRATKQPQQNRTPQQQPLSAAEISAERLIANQIRATWDNASILLARATQVAVELQITMNAHRTPQGSTSSSHATTTSTLTAPTTSALPTNSDALGLPDTISVITPPPKRTMARSLETLCRHIDYVITGRLRPLSPASTASDVSLTSPQQPPRVAGATSITANHQQDPAPVDLFDPLLAELQSLSVTADLKVLQHRLPTTNSPTLATSKTL